MSSEFSVSLLAWYEKHARDLPWRRLNNPYAIWIAEVMLQQTRVETVIPYYQRWLTRFPKVEALAEASRDEVLGLWEGLGYYQRAHNMYEAAKMIVQDQNGELPRRVEELVQLPGIGPYTAAAIAAIAFNQDVVAMDGNLRRVFSRQMDLTIDPRSPEGGRQLMAFAIDLLPTGRASTFNQALMDLGATICVPRDPACDQCPLAVHCKAFQRGVQNERPIRSTRPAVPHHIVAAAVLRQGRKVLIGRRPQGELLGGLWEFPGGTLERGETLESCLRRELEEELGVDVEIGSELGAYKHAYTHYKVTVHAFECSLLTGKPETRYHSELRWVTISKLEQYPMGKVDRAIARQIAKP
jgi:A/G-specific adenine glycosylase